MPTALFRFDCGLCATKVRVAASSSRRRRRRGRRGPRWCAGPAARGRRGGPPGARRGPRGCGRRPRPPRRRGRGSRPSRAPVAAACRGFLGKGEGRVEAEERAELRVASRRRTARGSGVLLEPRAGHAPRRRGRRPRSRGGARSPTAGRPSAMRPSEPRDGVRARVVVDERRRARRGSRRGGPPRRSLRRRRGRAPGRAATRGSREPPRSRALGAAFPSPRAKVE